MDATVAARIEANRQKALAKLAARKAQGLRPPADPAPHAARQQQGGYPQHQQQAHYAAQPPRPPPMAAAPAEHTYDAENRWTCKCGNKYKASRKECRKCQAAEAKTQQAPSAPPAQAPAPPPQKALGAAFGFFNGAKQAAERKKSRKSGGGFVDLSQGSSGSSSSQGAMQGGMASIFGGGGGGGGGARKRHKAAAPKREIPASFQKGPPLSGEQRSVLNLAMEGMNLFFTGNAGTGKSTLLHAMVAEMQRAHGPSRVFVTASTGAAACLLGGTTVHSFSGIGLGQGTPEELAKKVMSNRFSSKRWKGTDVLFIDEVSMLDADFLDKLEYVGRCVRESDLPFGGIQVLMCGDFFQVRVDTTTAAATTAATTAATAAATAAAIAAAATFTATDTATDVFTAATAASGLP